MGGVRVCGIHPHFSGQTASDSLNSCRVEFETPRLGTLRENVKNSAKTETKLERQGLKPLVIGIKRWCD